jgi:branched-subunit amino acid ABC-type transport system permease component
VLSDLLPFIIVGLTSGSVYALAAMGLTLTYRTTGVFNLAQGAIGAVAAYVFYDLTSHGMAWFAAAICILAVGVIGGVMMERVGYLAMRVDLALRILVTVGLMIGIQGLIVIRYGGDAVTVATFLPTNLNDVLGTPVSTDSLIVFGLALAAMLALTLLLRFSRFGVSTRAVVDDPTLLSLCGVNPNAVRRVSWIIGTVFAAVAGLLAAAAVGTLQPTLLTLLLINAFGAAALAAFRSIPLSYFGGLAVGVLASLATKYVHGGSFLSGLPAAIPVLVLFVALLLIPRRYLVVPVGRIRPRPRPNPSPRPVRVGMTLATIALFVFAPAIFGHARLPALTAVVAYAILLLSLILLVQLSGQVSLCQYGFAAVGAAAFYRLDPVSGLPWIPSVVLAGLIAMPVGALVAIPAARLSGLFLAVATFGFGVMLQVLFYSSGIMFGETSDTPAPRPGFATSDVAYYRVTLVALALCIGGFFLVDRSRLGRLLRGMGGSQTTMITHGTNVTITKVLVFSLSAFLAGIAGALYGPISENLSASSAFDPLLSLNLVALLMLVSVLHGGTVRPAIIGALILSLIPSYLTGETVNDYLAVLYGLTAIQITYMAATNHNVYRSVRERLASLSNWRRRVVARASA